MAASTVLRFITVRNPRKASDADLAQNFVFYDDGAVAAPLVRAARADWPAGRSAVYRRIREYTATNEYMKTTRQLKEVSGNLLDWGEWMIGVEGMLSVEALRDRLEKDPPEVSVEVERLLWDNLLAQTFVGGVPEVREGIIAALRAANLTHVDQDLLQKEKAVNALAAATVVAPRLSEDEPNLELHVEPDKPEGGDGVEAGKNPAEAPQTAELTKLQSAHTELLSKFRQEVASVRLEEAPAPPVPRAKRDGTGTEYPEDDAGAESVRVGVMDSEAKRRLSKDTRSTLEALGFRGDQDHAVPDMLVAIERSAQQKAAEASFDPRLRRSVVQVGGCGVQKLRPPGAVRLGFGMSQGLYAPRGATNTTSITRVSSSRRKRTRQSPTRRRHSPGRPWSGRTSPAGRPAIAAKRPSRSGRGNRLRAFTTAGRTAIRHGR